MILKDISLGDVKNLHVFLAILLGGADLSPKEIDIRDTSLEDD